MNERRLCNGVTVCVCTGGIATYFENLRELVQVNDGNRSFLLKTVDCHDQAAPFNDSQETRIAITHSDHICKIFVGFKSSNQILDQLQITCNNLNTGYQQNKCCREGFAYSTIKPHVEKKRKRYVHSLYENVSAYSQSVCSRYINIVDFKDGLPHKVEFEVNLPFDDIIALQAFDMFSNKVCGDLELKFYVKPCGLVWCMVDPMKVKEYKEYVEGETIDLTPDQNITAMFSHAFKRINNRAEIINKFEVSEKEIGEETTRVATVDKNKCLLQCTGMTILSLKSNMYGFKCKASSLQKIMGIFSTPQIIPSQGARFLHQSLVASDLASGFECTEEFEDSLVMAKNVAGVITTACPMELPYTHTQRV